MSKRGNIFGPDHLWCSQEQQTHLGLSLSVERGYFALRHAVLDEHGVVLKLHNEPCGSVRAFRGRITLCLRSGKLDEPKILTMKGENLPVRGQNLYTALADILIGLHPGCLMKSWVAHTAVGYSVGLEFEEVSACP